MPASRKSPSSLTRRVKSGLEAWSASQHCNMQLYLVTAKYNSSNTEHAQLTFDNKRIKCQTLNVKLFTLTDNYAGQHHSVSVTDKPQHPLMHRCAMITGEGWGGVELGVQWKRVPSAGPWYSTHTQTNSERILNVDQPLPNTRVACFFDSQCIY